MSKKFKKPTPEQPQNDEHHLQKDLQSFMREVDESLHYDRLMGLWQKWRAPLAVVIVLLFVTVGAREWYKSYTADKLQAQAAAYWQTTGGEGTMPKLDELEKLLTKTSDGFEFLTLLQKGKVLADNGLGEQAGEVFEAAAKNKSVPQGYRDLAQFYAALGYMEDNAKKAEGILQSLAVAEGVIRYSALENLGMLAEDQGNKVSAIDYFEQIVESKNPPKMTKERAFERLRELKK